MFNLEKMTTFCSGLYVNDLTIMTYKIHADLSIKIDSIENLVLPDFKGFKKNVIGLKDNKCSEENVKGRKYMTAIYQQYLLYPLQAGEIEIQPASMDVYLTKVNFSSQGPFDAFFNTGNTFKQRITLPGAIINASALATKAVGVTEMKGDFNMISDVDKKEINVGNTITFKVKKFGSGNIPIFKVIQIDFPEAFEVHEPKVTENYIVENGVPVGERENNYLLIARKAGTYTIPSISLQYYDTSASTYRILRTPFHRIRASPR